MPGVLAAGGALVRDYRSTGEVAWHRWHARWRTGEPPPDHPVAYPLRVAGRMRATCRCHWMTALTRQGEEAAA